MYDLSVARDRSKLAKQADELLNRGRGKRRKGKPGRSSKELKLPTPWAMENRGTLLAKDNTAEAHMQGVLTACGHPYTREYVARAKGRDYFIDFVVDCRGTNIGIEVDGKQHFTPKGQSADRIRDKALLEVGEVAFIVRLSWAAAMKMDRAAAIAMLEWASCAPAAGVALHY